MTGLGKKLILLVCLSVAAGRAQASDLLTKPSATPASGVADVSLAEAGSLTGRFVSSAGIGVDGALVVLSQRDAVLAKSTTNADGVYEFSGLRQGIYKLTVGHQSQTVRVWDEKTAPPSARSVVTTVRQDHVVRGQGAGGLAATVGIVGGVTGVALGGYAISVAKDAEDEAAEANRHLEEMEAEMITLRLSASP